MGMEHNLQAEQKKSKKTYSQKQVKTKKRKYVDYQNIGKIMGNALEKSFEN